MPLDTRTDLDLLLDNVRAGLARQDAESAVLALKKALACEDPVAIQIKSSGTLIWLDDPNFADQDAVLVKATELLERIEHEQSAQQRSAEDASSSASQAAEAGAPLELPEASAGQPAPDQPSSRAVSQPKKQDQSTKKSPVSPEKAASPAAGKKKAKANAAVSQSKKEGQGEQSPSSIHFVRYGDGDFDKPAGKERAAEHKERKRQLFAGSSGQAAAPSQARKRIALLVSVGQPYYEGRDAAAALRHLQFLAETQNVDVDVVIADTLQAHNAIDPSQLGNAGGQWRLICCDDEPSFQAYDLRREEAGTIVYRKENRNQREKRIHYKGLFGQYTFISASSGAPGEVPVLNEHGTKRKDFSGSFDVNVKKEPLPTKDAEDEWVHLIIRHLAEEEGRKWQARNLPEGRYPNLIARFWSDWEPHNNPAYASDRKNIDELFSRDSVFRLLVLRKMMKYTNSNHCDGRVYDKGSSDSVDACYKVWRLAVDESAQEEALDNLIKKVSEFEKWLNRSPNLEYILEETAILMQSWSGQYDAIYYKGEELLFDYLREKHFAAQGEKPAPVWISFDYRKSDLKRFLRDRTKLPLCPLDKYAQYLEPQIVAKGGPEGRAFKERFYYVSQAPQSAESILPGCVAVFKDGDFWRYQRSGNPSVVLTQRVHSEKSAMSLLGQGATPELERQSRQLESELGLLNASQPYVNVSLQIKLAEFVDQLEQANQTSKPFHMPAMPPMPSMPGFEKEEKDAVGSEVAKNWLAIGACQSLRVSADSGMGKKAWFNQVYNAFLDGASPFEYCLKKTAHKLAEFDSYEALWEDEFNLLDDERLEQNAYYRDVVHSRSNVLLIVVGYDQCSLDEREKAKALMQSMLSSSQHRLLIVSNSADFECDATVSLQPFSDEMVEAYLGKTHYRNVLSKRPLLDKARTPAHLAMLKIYCAERGEVAFNRRSDVYRIAVWLKLNRILSAVGARLSLKLQVSSGDPSSESKVFCLDSAAKQGKKYVWSPKPSKSEIADLDKAGDIVAADYCFSPSESAIEQFATSDAFRQAVDAQALSHSASQVKRIATMEQRLRIFEGALDPKTKYHSVRNALLDDLTEYVIREVAERCYGESAVGEEPLSVEAVNRCMDEVMSRLLGHDHSDIAEIASLAVDDSFILYLEAYYHASHPDAAGCQSFLTSLSFEAQNKALSSSFFCEYQYFSESPSVDLVKQSIQRAWNQTQKKAARQHYDLFKLTFYISHLADLGKEQILSLLPGNIDMNEQLEIAIEVLNWTVLGKDEHFCSYFFDLIRTESFLSAENYLGLLKKTYTADCLSHLMLATCLSNARIYSVLLDKMEEVFADAYHEAFTNTDKRNRRILTFAVDRGDAELCRVLLNKMRQALGSRRYREALIHQDDEGMTALMHAAYKGHEEVCLVLLKEIKEELKGDYASALIQTNKYNMTALMAAAQEGHEAAFSVLLTEMNMTLGDDDYSEELRRVASNGHTPFMMAALSDHAGICLRLLDEMRPKLGDDYAKELTRLDRDGTPILVLVAQTGCEAACSVLLGAMKDKLKEGFPVALMQPAANGWSAFMHAAKGGHAGCCSVLLAHMEDQLGNAYRKALMQATEVGGFTALIIAACEGHVGVCSVLLPKMSKALGTGYLEGLMRSDNNSLTALLFAAHKGFQTLCSMLLAQMKAASRSGYADLLVNGSEGYRALSIAACEGHVGVCSVLLDEMKSVLRSEDYTKVFIKPDHQGWIPLVRAADGGHSSACKVFLDEMTKMKESLGDAYPDIVRVIVGQRALVRAAEGGHKKACSVLLDGMGTALGDDYPKALLGDGYSCVLSVESVGHEVLVAALRGGHEALYSFLLAEIEQVLGGPYPQCTVISKVSGGPVDETHLPMVVRTMCKGLGTATVFKIFKDLDVYSFLKGVSGGSPNLASHWGSLPDQEQEFVRSLHGLLIESFTALAQSDLDEKSKEKIGKDLDRFAKLLTTSETPKALFDQLRKNHRILSLDKNPMPLRKTFIASLSELLESYEPTFASASSVADAASTTPSQTGFFAADRAPQSAAAALPDEAHSWVSASVPMN